MREAAMEGGHRPLWWHFIGSIIETHLSTRRVIDFGCNGGGFLRLLHSLKPFRQGLGIDIAQDSIAAARNLAVLHTFRETISKIRMLRCKDRATDDYAATFAAAVFQVSCVVSGLVPAPKDRSDYPRLMDAVDYALSTRCFFAS